MQRLRRLASSRSTRLAERCFVVEGVKVVREALSAGVDVESVYIDRTGGSPDGSLDDLLAEAYATGSRVFELASGVLSRVADTVTPQPVMAVVRQMDVPLTALRRPRAAADPASPGRTTAAATTATTATDGTVTAGITTAATVTPGTVTTRSTTDGRAAEMVVVCVDLRDPGNAGTVLRSAEAAGATGVVFCDGSVDLFNPKTVRASAGSLFRLPVVAGGDAADVLAEMGAWGLTRWATTPRGGDSYTDVDLTGPVALVLGNEAHGLPPGLEGLLDGQVTIPMAGRAESLNAGMAGAVLCFEAARQRRAPRPTVPVAVAVAR